MFDRETKAAALHGAYDWYDTAKTAFYHCLRCGRSYEVTDPQEIERLNGYKNYWNKKVKSYGKKNKESGQEPAT